MNKLYSPTIYYLNGSLSISPPIGAYNYVFNNVYPSCTADAVEEYAPISKTNAVDLPAEKVAKAAFLIVKKLGTSKLSKSISTTF